MILRHAVENNSDEASASEEFSISFEKSEVSFHGLSDQLELRRVQGEQSRQTRSDLIKQIDLE
jgi:hypothetical protein